jgi:hypothetical protein
MLDRIKQIFSDLPQQLGLVILVLLYILLYLLQNVIKDKLNIDISHIIKNTKALSFAILVYFTYYLLTKKDNGDLERCLLIAFIITLIVVLVLLIFQDQIFEQPRLYEECISKYYHHYSVNDVERLCQGLSKDRRI